MKIKAIKSKMIDLKLVTPFITAALTRTSQPTVIVKVETDEGIYGIGESVPTRHITAETFDSVLTVHKELTEKLVGVNVLDIENIHYIMDKHIVGNPAAKAGIDLALYDIKGKIMNAPLYKVLGGFKNTLETDVTISILPIDEMVAEAKKNVADGFNIIKIKIGLDPEKDIEVVKKIRECVGDKVILKADANQGYTVPDAVKVFNALLKYNVLGIEQPVAHWDINSMKSVREKTTMKIVADEAVHNHYDAMRYIKANACDMVNIKLMKSSGIFKAEKINAASEAAGMKCMVGCMVESRIAITAGAHFAASKKNIEEVDLDSFMLVKEVDGISGGFTNKNSIITLLDKPGLGLDVDFEKI